MCKCVKINVLTDLIFFVEGNIPVVILIIAIIVVLAGVVAGVIWCKKCEYLYVLDV